MQASEGSKASDSNGLPCRRRGVLQLPAGLLTNVIRIWIPLEHQETFVYGDNEEIVPMWHTRKRASHVNQTWRCAMESDPIIGQSQCHILSQNLPVLLNSKLTIRHLILRYCYNREFIRSEHRLKHGISEETTLRAVSSLATLEHLTLRGFKCPAMDLSVLHHLPHLASLSIECNPDPQQLLHMMDLQRLACMPTLSVLRLDQFPTIDCASLVSPRRNSLTALIIRGCTQMENTTCLGELNGIQNLTLRYSSRLPSVSFLVHLSASLTCLDLNHSLAANVDLTPLEGLIQLNSLSLQATNNNISSVGKLTALQHLNLNSSALSDLNPLSTLIHLKSLNLDWCVLVSDITPLAHLSSLTSLRLKQCWGITNLDGINTAVHLQELHLTGCAAITDISPLRLCNMLTKLCLGFCTGITDISPLSSCQALRKLLLCGCTGVTDLSPIAYQKLNGLDYETDIVYLPRFLKGFI